MVYQHSFQENFVRQTEFHFVTLASEFDHCSMQFITRTRVKGLATVHCCLFLLTDWIKFIHYNYVCKLQAITLFEHSREQFKSMLHFNGVSQVQLTLPYGPSGALRSLPTLRTERFDSRTVTVQLYWTTLLRWKLPPRLLAVCFSLEISTGITRRGYLAWRRMARDMGAARMLPYRSFAFAMT